ncbi:WhiB family transcriptional regulator [Streptomyces kaempferi]|uniref:WhiB family transcriptional regulator n=1 Tax=Streptomyces kaempferi TaxID=333725 RepID=A0ABW3XUG0_9ACTN
MGSHDEYEGPLERERRVWSADAAELFADSPRQKRSKITWMRCPVRTECLAETLDDRFECGMWGGMTERERRVLTRREPDIWLSVLKAERESVVPPAG